MAEIAHRSSGELTRRRIPDDNVDPIVEPSVGWGWHQHFPRGAIVLGVLVALAVLSLLLGHQPNPTEFGYDVGIAVILLLLVVRAALRRRHAWRK